MLNLVDRLSNPGHAEFVNRTQIGQADGRATAAIRPVRPADLAALSDFFAGLSVESRYLRFFAPVTPAYGLLHLLSGGPAGQQVQQAVGGCDRSEEPEITALDGQSREELAERGLVLRAHRPDGGDGAAIGSRNLGSVHELSMAGIAESVN